jgi:hypothetical protein
MSIVSSLHHDFIISLSFSIPTPTYLSSGYSCKLVITRRSDTTVDVLHVRKIKCVLKHAYHGCKERYKPVTLK